MLKVNVPESYYHAHAQGRGMQKIFRKHEDFEMFLSLFECHLSNELKTNANTESLEIIEDELANTLA